ncbi:MAG: hypothetical protein ABIS35_13495 [Terracoccus sp.]
MDDTTNRHVDGDRPDATRPLGTDPTRTDTRNDLSSDPTRPYDWSAQSTDPTRRDPASTLQIDQSVDPTAPAFRVAPVIPVPDDAVQGDEVAGGRPLHQQGWAPAPSAARPQWGPPGSLPTATAITVNRGPRASSILLGFLCLVVAAYVLVTTLTDTVIDPTTFGPVVFAALGGVLVLVGVAGVLANRRRNRVR